MITTVVSREDHASNLLLKTCLLSYNLHVRFFFEMKKKKKKKTQCAPDIRANFFSKANGKGERIFKETLFSTFKKRRFKVVPVAL